MCYTGPPCRYTTAMTTEPMTTKQGLAQVGVRALRNEVSGLIRRAADGERIIITVDGRPMAQLGPLEPDSGGLTLEDLAAAGLIEPPLTAPSSASSPSSASPASSAMAVEEAAAFPPPFNVAADVRLDRLIEQIRGR